LLIGSGFSADIIVGEANQGQTSDAEEDHYSTITVFHHSSLVVIMNYRMSND
jgi:hypothetical protein